MELSALFAVSIAIIECYLNSELPSSCHQSRIKVVSKSIAGNDFGSTLVPFLGVFGVALS